jgi:hypothetical protein
VAENVVGLTELEIGCDRQTGTSKYPGILRHSNHNKVLQSRYQSVLVLIAAATSPR